MPAVAPTSHAPGSLLVGALKQLVNELAARTRLPLGPLPPEPIGDVFEPIGDRQRTGASLVEQAAQLLTGRHDVDPQQARSRRPLLATHQIAVAPGRAGSARLVLDASAPGARWDAAGRESGMIAVYVNGRYHSSVLVLGEQQGPLTVNLGQLPAGRHHVELRAATDVAPVQPVLHAVHEAQVSGEQALIDRLAPVLELRDLDRSARSASARDDAPLLLVPAVTRHADGTRTIEYRVVFSNENGGTPSPKLLGRYGRAIDVEPVYRVTVDRGGRVVAETYHAALHRWRAFDGRRDGGRAVIRVATTNNLVSAREARSGRAERWSIAPTAPVEASDTDFALMRRHPWLWTVMSRELAREGKVATSDAARGALQVLDPRRYVFLGPLGDAARAALARLGGLELVLADGRRVLARAMEPLAAGHDGATALVLPAGVDADAVRGIMVRGLGAVVLDARHAPRELMRVEE